MKPKHQTHYPWNCTAELLNNPDDKFLLACCREPGHPGDHHCGETGFAWSTFCNYREHMLWGSRGTGWQILDESQGYVELFNRVLAEPHRWQVRKAETADESDWIFRTQPSLNDECNYFRGSGLLADLLAAAWNHANSNQTK